MEIINSIQPQTSCLIRIMTSDHIDATAEYLKIISNSDDLRKLAKMITSDLDLFVKILSSSVGTCRVLRMLGTSEEINTILFHPIIQRFSKIMTHRGSTLLGLRILDVCNVHQIRLFCSLTLSIHHMLSLWRSEHGCIVFRRVLAIADDCIKDDFLSLIADLAYLLSWSDSGMSLIKHVLTLGFTHKTTQDDTHLHKVMAKFDEALSNSDIERLHRLALTLTSDPKLFMDFVKTRRGSLMVQITLGKSERIDRLFLKAIKRSLTDVITIKFRFGYRLVYRLVYVFKERGNYEVDRLIQEEIALKALYLAKYPMGSVMVQRAVDVRNEPRTVIVAARLHRHYVKLSFHEHGSEVVEKLVGEGESLLALSKMVLELVKCDDDVVVRLAKDKYGNKVLKKTLEFAKKVRRANLLGDLVKKLKPLLGQLRGSQGDNIEAIIDSE